MSSGQEISNGSPAYDEFSSHHTERKSMQIVKHAWATFQARRKWQLHEMNDWVLAALGGGSFLIAGYWSMAVIDVLPALLRATNQHALNLPASAAFVFLAGLGVTVWFHGTLAKRCHEILKERHFR